MTITEAKQLFTEVVFVHFPNVYGWLRNNSPKPEETLLVWCRVLEPIELSEAISVVYRWSSGQVQAPTGFEVESIALQIKSLAMKDRFEAKKHLVRQEITDNPTGVVVKMSMGPYFQRILANGAKLRAGEITEQQCNEMNKQVLKEFDDKCKASARQSSY